jgi:hypothetical protein
MEEKMVLESAAAAGDEEAKECVPAWKATNSTVIEASKSEEASQEMF